MSALSLTTIPASRPGVLAQPIKPGDPTLVLLNPQTGEYFTLEAVGTRVWQLCDGKHTVSEIAAIISAEYDESHEVIARDVMELLEELFDAKLVVTPG